MATSKKLTGKKSKSQTSSQAATPANRSRKQANAKVPKTQDTCGHGYEKPLANYDPTTQSWKMCQVISLWEEPKSLERLPKSGMTLSGVLYQQPDWVPIISEKESSSWPTPTAVTRPMEGNVRMYRAKIMAGEMTEQEAEEILGKSVWAAQGKIPATWPTPTASDHIERKSTQQTHNSRHSLNLQDAVKRWPTPTTQEVEHPNAIWNEQMRRVSSTGTTHSMNLADAARMWPTPTANDSKNVNPKPNRFHGLVAEVNQTTQATGKLNPTWVEWLMGFPTGWTDLEDSETQ
jgi:hypothetical protein